MPGARYVQMATVRPDGTPANRTLVFRGFVEGEDLIRFASDMRSEKIQELAHQPIAEACWYMSDSMEQFRFRGKLLVISEKTNDDRLRAERLMLWRRLDNEVRSLILGPKPGLLRSPEEDFALQGSSDDAPPANFALLILDPFYADYLDLRPTPHSRMRFERDQTGEWMGDPINP